MITRLSSSSTEVRASKREGKINGDFKALGVRWVQLEKRGNMSCVADVNQFPIQDNTRWHRELSNSHPSVIVKGRQHGGK